MQFCLKQARLPKISQHRLTLLRSSNSWKKFLILPRMTVYAFIQIHSLTNSFIPSPRTTSYASSIVLILGRKCYSQFFQAVMIPKFRPYNSGFSKSLGQCYQGRTKLFRTKRSLQYYTSVGLSSKFQTSLHHQHFQEERLGRPTCSQIHHPLIRLTLEICLIDLS